MKLQDIIQRVIGGQTKENTKMTSTEAKVPEKTTTTLASTGPVSTIQVETMSPQPLFHSMTVETKEVVKPTSKKQSSTSTKKATKAARSNYVKDEDLDEKIKRVTTRLAYLRNRRKTGVPGGEARKKTLKRYGADFAYYKYWVKGKDYLRQYKDLREAAMVANKRFVSFHNRLMQVIEHFGSEQEKEALRATMGNNNEEIKL